MARLYVYKQFIGSMGTSGWYLTLSENAPSSCSLNEATCLGSLDLQHVESNDSHGQPPALLPIRCPEPSPSDLANRRVVPVRISD